MRTATPSDGHESPDASAFALVAARLREHGWAELASFAEPCLLAELRADLDRAEHAGRLRAAGTGSGHAPRRDGTLRGDAILWLEREASPAQSALLACLDVWRIALNRELWLGLEEVEAHYALYPPGAGYARHRDRFRDDDARVLSFVLYLNPDWQTDDGGELRLHLPDGTLDIAPRLGRAVFFLSAEIEHEVLPAKRERRSIAGWFRRPSTSRLRRYAQDERVP
ncbi:MAG: 2OG-Fe(II) oxygenase [Chiayiivirga sp.]|jgi:SM-20-related protein|uniref:2OG-Fe(II) oxygenase n=1 Tax=Chiayiivirga sp. TaxID=2041042 RepID=UPI0025C2CFA0|nr:2OG-Fe(II) oxygenase [Chiayiivirga sp.]MCI1709472.1 2OG-Fe(II) oxygenase [Chiayiivirga sp.]MCI1730240.1 2OG-Fe(II) oxygenase [Chiayiivirga sp.]